MWAVVANRPVDLVGEHQEIPLDGDPGDRFDVLAGEGAATRVVGEGEDEELGSVRHQRSQLVGIDPELVLFPEGNGHTPGSHEGADRLVHGKPGIRVHHLVAFLAEGQEHVPHDRFGTGCDDDPLGAGGEAAGRFEELGHGLPQLGDPGCGNVVGVSRFQGGCRRLPDVGRCVEVGLADLQVDDLPTLSLKGLGVGEDLEGRLGAQAFHSIGQVHGIPSRRPAGATACYQRARRGRGPAPVEGRAG